jgi:3-oxoacyl-[acyl-carrier protein] reductase
LSNDGRGQAALVVGAGGIGGAIASRFVEEGATVVVASRHAREGPQARQFETMRLDAADPGECRAVVQDIVARHGRLDSVVNSSSLPLPGTTGEFARVDPSLFEKSLALAIAPSLNLCSASHAALAASGGTLVLFASDAALFSARNQAIIAATRAAIVTFVRNYALEAAADGVRAHCVTCSYVRDTPVYGRLKAMNSSRVETAERRAALGLPTPQDIAPTVTFLCSPGASRMTGQVISINGGLST